MRADLHLHSNASDGLHRPREVMRRAFGAGLAAVALTDHDTLAGTEEAAAEAQRLGLRFVSGCEISIAVGERDVHVLAYFLRVGQPAFESLLANMDRGRRERVAQMVQRLQRAGIALDLADVLAVAGPSHSLGRMHVARALVRAGVVGHTNAAFTTWIGTGMPAYVPKRTAPAERVLETVWGCGGVPVLAHPGGGGLEGLEGAVAAWDLGGVEVYHPAHDRAAEARYAEWARARDWVVTGGSDWHGDARGPALGSRSVDVEVIGALAARRRVTPS